MTSLKILSGGAAQGLVASLAAQFKEQTGLAIEGEFGAVGAMAGKLRGGTPADIVILTAKIIADLAAENLVVPASITDVGRVETAIAVRTGDPKVPINDAASCAPRCLPPMQSSFPTPRRRRPTSRRKGSAAAGHCRRGDRPAQNLSERRDRNAPTRRIRRHPPIGCTQSTEILNTKDVILSGSLPKGSDLATIYTAAVTTTAHPGHARNLIELVDGADQVKLREPAGFLTNKIAFIAREIRIRRCPTSPTRLIFRGQLAISLSALDEMPAHRLPGLFRRMGADRLKDRLVLLFNPGKIFAQAFRAPFERANALPGNDQAAEKIEKLDEAAILGRQRRWPDGRRSPP